VTVAADSLVVSDDQEAPVAGVLTPVMLRDDPAVIPDLGQIEELIAQAIAQAA
jgi:hypothetical protein